MKGVSVPDRGSLFLFSRVVLVYVYARSMLIQHVLELGGSQG